MLLNKQHPLTANGYFGGFFSLQGSKGEDVFMLTKVHTLQKMGTLWRKKKNGSNLELELHQDAHHFYLGSFAGVL